MSQVTVEQVDSIFEILRKNAEASYLGENVTQLAHGLQAAHFAELDKAEPSIILAALFHDIGHFTHDFPEDCADDNIDSRHEESAMAVLDGFPDAFTQPIRWHVDAKRYLCGQDPDYMNGLSEASKHSLKLQGGPMSAEELSKFEQRPHWQEAVQLRGYDDAGKMIDMETPDLDHYYTMMRDWLKV